MTRSFWSPLRPRLRAPTSLNESLRIERVIAAARLLLTGVALLQIRIDPIEPSAYHTTAMLLLILFAAHGISAMLVLRTRQKTSHAFIITTFVVDVIAATITLPIAAPANAFFVFFLFVIATTAFRWGFRETMAVAGGAIVLVVCHALVVQRSDITPLVHFGIFSFDRMIGRIAYLGMIGLLLGYLAEEGRVLRAEAAAIARLLTRIRVESGLARASTVAAKEILSLFSASRLLVLMEQRDTRHLFRWDTSGGWGVAPAMSPDEIEGPDRETYLFCPADASVYARRGVFSRSKRARHHVLLVDGAGRTMDGSRIRVPARLTELAPYRRFISVPVVFGEEWAGRVFLFDPKLQGRPLALTQFLQSVARQVVPALYSVHLAGQLQERAGALERARVARELHDGVIQALIGVELNLDLVRRQEPIRSAPVSAEIGRIQKLVKNEVMNLRELMQQMRPPEFDPDELLAYLADMVQRFGRDTGIAATFLSDLKDVRLPWRVCFELVRIVQEGLVNVRKHSAASNVVVRFGVRDGHWTLEINDDGKGFPFEGRFSHGELETGRRGPTIIKERVKAIGGQLAIDSSPSRGTRLEILVPQGVHG